MTRKEQIKEYLLTIGNGEMTGIPFDVGFECGVEWADSHPRWISVKDELPKEDGQYLGCVKGKTQDIVSYLSGRWLLCNRFDITKVITHWMPLPTPHETWIFIDGAHWADRNPPTETINRIIELYKNWYSEQCDIALADYIEQNY